MVNEVVLAIVEKIEELISELEGLRLNDFPQTQSELFLAKCVHLSDLLVTGASFHEKVPLNTSNYLRQNFSKALNWLLALKYRYVFLASISKKVKKPWRKKLELSVPSFLHWEMEEG